MNSEFTRRNFTARVAALFSAAGFTTAALAGSAQAKTADKNPKKLDMDGKPADPKSFITPVIIHNGLVYVSGQGAHDTLPQDQWDIAHHTTIVLDHVKKAVETGGGTMDSMLQCGVFLADIKYYDGMNNVFKTYFPNGGPARTTVAVAALPGNSLVEINCIAAVVKK